MACKYLYFKSPRGKGKRCPISKNGYPRAKQTEIDQHRVVPQKF